MIGKSWGLTPKLTLWLYTAVIRPMINYGAVVWWRRTLLTTTQSKLQSWQRLVCMAITGSMRTTPTMAMEAMLNILPLHLFIQQEAAVTAVRLKTHKLLCSTGIPHIKILEDIAKDIPLMEAPNDGIQIKYIFDKKYKIQLEEDSRVASIVRDLSIFTDGSKTKTGSGSGIFSEDLNINISLPIGTYNAVFQAECLGILEAARTIGRRNVKNSHIRILSDSMSVLQALDSKSTTSGIIYECHNTLMQVGENNDITLQWIKGHNNTRGNDRADELARRGSSMSAIGAEPIMPLPSCWLKGQIRQRMKRKHITLWSEIEDCRQAKLALPEIDAKLARILINLDRRQLRLITAALTGHGPYNKHLFNMGITDSPLCRACMGTEETATHVLLYCPGVAAYRAQHLGTLKTLPEIFKKPKKLLKFLEELGWQE
ncbi:uncharacterized protein LOC123662152 [Melitaea cinxia]|uniref:uncharacterized protein LOC123662152 n=1 Tax=Melitaea cinxia TaxID=113334 RepID=UPI001E272064|nr:uncharacterized protein LOC123662152 [Melitaea cinxia]